MPAPENGREEQPAEDRQPLSADTGLDWLTAVLARARAAGADAADAVVRQRRSLSVAWRMGKQEALERAEGVELGVRVFVGHRQALAATSDLSPLAVGALLDRVMAMAFAAPEDTYSGIADPDQLATRVDDLDLIDPVEPSPETLLERAARTEDAARAVPGIDNSEGAEASWGGDAYTIAATNGLAQTIRHSWHTLGVSVLARDGAAMERDHDYASAIHAADLRTPEDIGHSAGERAVRRLGPRKVATAKVPVIFDPRVARSLLSHLAAAIAGPAVARGTTFLKDKLGSQILPPGTAVIDDPLRRRGLRSRPFDGEGIATQRRTIIDDGRLTTWLLDLRSARQLQLASTGHASRGPSSLPSPSPSNLYLAAGTMAPEALIRDVASGLYVTELIGFGVNGVTGDYSRGASGFWIESGEIVYPVSEVTVSGTLLAMFAHMTIASDLEWRYGVDSPTVRIDGMTVGGR